MNNKIQSFRSGALLAAIAIICLTTATSAHATFVNLGAASQYAALALYNDIMISGPSGVEGNAGVANGASSADVGNKLDISGSSFVSGHADIHTGASFNTSGTAYVGTLNQNAATDAILNHAFSDALNASTMAAALVGQNLTVTDSNLTISEAAVGNYVFKIGSISLSGSHAITLSAPAGSTFTFDISGGFMFSGSSHISVAGGLTQNDVMFNILGTGPNVSLSGGAYVEGVILAPQRQADIGPVGIKGFTVNQIIAAGISIHSGGLVVAPVPEVTPSSVIFGFIGLVVAFGSRRTLLRRAVAAAGQRSRFLS